MNVLCGLFFLFLQTISSDAILNGENVTGTAYYQAAIYYDNFYRCSGALIRGNVIVTLTSCLFDRVSIDQSTWGNIAYDPTKWKVFIGNKVSHDNGKPNATEMNLREVKKVVPHNGFSKDNYTCNIGMLILTNDVTDRKEELELIGDELTKIYSPNSALDLFGFGAVEIFNSRPIYASILQKLKTKQIKCEEEGPLVFEIFQRYFLVGVHIGINLRGEEIYDYSRQFCMIHTKVLDYRSWINNKIAFINEGFAAPKFEDLLNAFAEREEYVLQALAKKDTELINMTAQWKKDLKRVFEKYEINDPNIPILWQEFAIPCNLYDHVKSIMSRWLYSYKIRTQEKLDAIKINQEEIDELCSSIKTQFASDEGIKTNLRCVDRYHGWLNKSLDETSYLNIREKTSAMFLGYTFKCNGFRDKAAKAIDTRAKLIERTNGIISELNTDDTAIISKTLIDYKRQQIEFKKYLQDLSIFLDMIFEQRFSFANVLMGMEK